MNRAPDRALPIRPWPFAASAPPRLDRTRAEIESMLETELCFLMHSPADTAWIAIGPHHVAYIAGRDADRERIARETLGFDWLRRHHVDVPATIMVRTEGNLLVTERVPEDPAEGPSYVAAACAAAEAIAGTPPGPLSDSGHPALTEASGRRGWREHLHRTVWLARLAGIGVSPRRVLDARRTVAQLPTVLSHGDFRTTNVLFDADRGQVHVVDLEELRLAPYGHDHLTLWMSLATTDDREHVLELLAARVAPGRGEGLAALHRWVAYRAASGLLSVDPTDGNLRCYARTLIDEAEDSVLRRCTR